MAKIRYPVCSRCGTLLFNPKKDSINYMTKFCGECSHLIVKDGIVQLDGIFQILFKKSFKELLYLETDIDLTNITDDTQLSQFETEYQTFFDTSVVTNPNYKPEFHEYVVKQKERELRLEEQHRRDEASVNAIIKARERERYQREHPNVKCPTCGSTNIERISTINRAVSVGMLGLASDKIGKQFQCKNCKYKW